jgi:hypothetical protein
MRGGPARAFGAVALTLLAAACDPLPPPPDFRIDAAGPPPAFDGGTILLPDGSVPPGRVRLDGGPVLPEADEEIVLPYLGPEATRSLSLGGDVGTLDVFFLVDTTGSFAGEIDQLQATLLDRILPDLRARIRDVAVGVGSFEDFPGGRFGSEEDRPFTLESPVTTDDRRVGRAVAELDQPLGMGGDVQESLFEALYQAATGQGYPGVVAPFRGPAAIGGGTLGGAGFREDAFRVAVTVTDAPSHRPADYGSLFPGTRGLAEATDALVLQGIRVLGISSGFGGREDLEALALGTGAVAPPSGGECATGLAGAANAPVGDVCPLVYDIREDGTGLDTAVTDAIVDLLRTVEYDAVTVEADDDFGFVAAVETAEAISPEGAAPPGTDDRQPPEGVDDTFVAVPTGASLRFTVRLRNTTIPPADYDQIFRIALRVVGDGVTLTSRTLRIVVPFGRPDAGPVDGGLVDGGCRRRPIDGGSVDGGG